MIRQALSSTAWLPILVIALAVNLALYGAMTKLSHRREGGLQKQYEKPILLTLPEKKPLPEKKKRKPLKKKALKVKKMQTLTLKRPKTPPPPSFEFSKPSGGMAVVPVFTTEITQQLPSFEAPRTLFDLSELDQKPRLLYRVNPIYPYTAKRRNMSGELMLQFIVDNEGNVKQIEVIKAQPQGIFDESAISAVQKWRFKPGYIQGEAVSTRVVVPINFKI